MSGYVVGMCVFAAHNFASPALYDNLMLSYPSENYWNKLIGVHFCLCAHIRNELTSVYVIVNVHCFRADSVCVCCLMPGFQIEDTNTHTCWCPVRNGEGERSWT